LSFWFGHWLDFLGGRLQVCQLSLSLLSKRFHVQVTVAKMYFSGMDEPPKNPPGDYSSTVVTGPRSLCVKNNRELAKEAVKKPGWPLGKSRGSKPHPWASTANKKRWASDPEN
jgi:hypothetical protein